MTGLSLIGQIRLAVAERFVFGCLADDSPFGLAACCADEPRAHRLYRPDTESLREDGVMASAITTWRNLPPIERGSPVWILRSGPTISASRLVVWNLTGPPFVTSIPFPLASTWFDGVMTGTIGCDVEGAAAFLKFSGFVASAGVRLKGKKSPDSFDGFVLGIAGMRHVVRGFI